MHITMKITLSNGSEFFDVSDAMQYIDERVAELDSPRSLATYILYECKDGDLTSADHQHMLSIIDTSITEIRERYLLLQDYNALEGLPK